MNRNMITAMANEKQEKIIEVVGNASIDVEPDAAVINIGVITENKDLSIAQKENKKTINNVIRVLKKYNVKEEHIKTSEFTVNPIYNFIEGKRELNGYEIRHILEVMVDNIEDIGLIIEDAVMVGANSQTNIRFIVKDKEKYYQEALVNAVLNGKEKAIKIANSVNAKINELPLKIKEIYENRNEQMFNIRYANGGGTPIQTGLIQISAMVEETYEVLS